MVEAYGTLRMLSGGNSQGLWSFELSKPHAGGVEPELPDPKPSVMSLEGPQPLDSAADDTSRASNEEISGAKPVALKHKAKH